jgi:hypothetical protein
MSIFKPLKNQRGSLVATVICILAIGAPVLYTMGAYMESRRADVQNVQDKLEKGEDISEAEFEAARTAVPDVAQVNGAGGAVLNSVSNIGVPSVQTAVGVISDTAISETVSRSTDPATTSNPTPSDIHPPGTCGSSALANCTSRSSCTAAGGYWRSNNTCGASPDTACAESDKSACGTASSCTAVGGFWYDNQCNEEPEQACNSAHLDLCATSSDCIEAGGYWYNVGFCSTSW